jgi:hypothetical protein
VNSATPADFSLSVAPPSVTIPKGLGAVYTVSVTPTGGFTGTVTLGCTTDAALATCSVVPGSVSLSSGAAQSAKVTVQTSLGSELFPPFTPPDGWAALRLALLLLLATSFVVLTRRPLRQRRWATAMAFAVVVFLGGWLLAGCASRGAGSPRGTHVVTVTGTSGALNHNAAATLVIQ